MDDNAREIAIPTTREAAAEDERLVQECLAGDERAWNTLIEKYKRLIYRLMVQGDVPF